MAHQFSMVPQAKIPRSSFNRSHGLKTTLNAGDLVPVFLDEVLPGDTHVLRGNFFGRLSTPLKPIMDNIFMDTFFFFVPYRLLWDNWQKFNGEQDNPGDSTDFVIPTRNLGTVAEGTLADYFGIPVGTFSTATACDFPFRAYNLIYNEWFRDQNLQNSLTHNTGDNAASITEYAVRKRGKRHDYFTSCLPWPQKGPDVSVSIGDIAPVFANLDSNALLGVRTTRAPGSAISSMKTDGGVGLDQLYLGQDTGGANQLLVDLSGATGVTINDLRQSFQIQKLLERDARGGTRYIEIIRSHFGVISPDARLQRPEFLGGGTAMVNINPVAQQGASGVDTSIIATPQGNLAAYGTVSASGHGFTKSFTEHGLIMGLVNFRADLTYQQGLDRMWSRRGRFDFFWPALAHLGEQAVLNKEIYLQGTVDDDNVFGYQERYAEYRYKPSRITGLFRSAATSSLDVWHLAQDFGSLPVLGDTFIQDNPPIDRISAVPSEPHFLLDCYFQLRSVRPMPLYGVPGLIDHF